MGRIKILTPGFFTTIQDMGRYGFQQFGVSACGVMDSYAYKAANLLLGNPLDAAVLEVSLLGPEIEFLLDSSIAITGGDLTPAIDGKIVPMWESIPVKKSSVLSFKGLKSGARSYISFGGGINTEPIMGSRSTDIKAGIGGINGKKLSQGDTIDLGEWNNKFSFKKLSEEAIPEYKSAQSIRVILGPQADYFTEKGISTFLNSAYTVSGQFDRMGYRLEGDKIESKKGSDIISDGISMGSIQIPGSGKPIILMADRQTAGGYTKIGVVATADLYKIAQAKQGDSFNFVVITVEDGQRLFKEQEMLLRRSIIDKTEEKEIFSAKAKQYNLTINNKAYFITITEQIK